MYIVVLVFCLKLLLWAGRMRALAFSSCFLVMVCNYNISFWSFESCEMKWKLVCFSSWSGIVKVLLWGTWSDPKLGCWLFKRGVLSQQGCPVQGFKQAEGASWGGGYQNIEIPTCRQGHGHWGSKHTQTKRLLLSQDTVHKTETKAQANMRLIVMLMKHCLVCCSMNMYMYCMTAMTYLWVNPQLTAFEAIN